MGLVPLEESPGACLSLSLSLRSQFLSLPLSLFSSFSLSLSLSPSRIQREDSHLQPGRGSSPEPHHAGTLISDFQPPELGERNFCCY